MTDLVIKNARVINGNRADAFQADLAVSNGIITHMDPEVTLPCSTTNDASGLVTSNGFIDIHTILIFPSHRRAAASQNG